MFGGRDTPGRPEFTSRYWPGSVIFLATDFGDVYARHAYRCYDENTGAFLSLDRAVDGLKSGAVTLERLSLRRPPDTWKLLREFKTDCYRTRVGTRRRPVLPGERNGSNDRHERFLGWPTGDASLLRRQLLRGDGGRVAVVSRQDFGVRDVGQSGRGTATPEPRPVPARPTSDGQNVPADGRGRRYVHSQGGRARLVPGRPKSLERPPTETRRRPPLTAERRLLNSSCAPVRRPFRKQLQHILGGTSRFYYTLHRAQVFPTLAFVHHCSTKSTPFSAPTEGVFKK